MVFWRNENAVSPVIGTVLMVAITVIIAAVIAAYVFGVPQEVTKSNIIAATAQLDNSGSILVTYQGGQDHEKLSSLTIIGPDGVKSTPYISPNVGAVWKLDPISGWPPPGQLHVQVVGEFKDGVKQVVLDTIV
jgi:flagellin-like protein